MAQARAREADPLRGLGEALVQTATRAGLGIIVTRDAAPEAPPEFANPTAAALLGYAEDELRAVAASALFAPGEPSDSAAAHQDDSTFLTTLVRKDGTWVAARIAQLPAQWGGHPARVNLVVDFPERHRAEYALRSSELRYRTVIDAAPDAVFIAGRDGVVYANAAAVQMLGVHGVSELRGVDPTDRLHPDDVTPARAHASRALRSDAPEGPIEIRIRHADGGTINVEVVSMLTEWDGRPALLHVGRELSGRKQVQAQLIQADRLTAVGTLAAGVAHEINNPLAYVLLNLQYVLRELPTLGGSTERLDQLMERLSEAQHGAERVSTIVRDLRQFSSTETQEEVAPVELRRVLDAAIKVASTRIHARARLIQDHQDVPTVRGHAAKLEQVFLNLLINAAQSLPPGQPELNEIRVRTLRQSEDRIVVEVADTGAGIPPELLDRVFDPFFSTKPAAVGTGLGLPICHNIVSSLGGEIAVESELGRGTVFRVVLRTMERVAAPRQLTPQPFAAVTATGVERVRVLVVDDELAVASMLSRILANEHDVTVRTSGQEALELLLGEEQFDLVLCDLLMPGMSGMDLHEQLQARRPGLEKRLVFMTGGAFTPRASEFLSRVSNRRVEKPFDLKKVRSVVRELAHRGSGSSSG